MKTINFLILNALFACSLFAQERQIPIDTLVTTNHSTTIKGAAVNYQHKQVPSRFGMKMENPLLPFFIPTIKEPMIKAKPNDPSSFLLMEDPVPLLFGCMLLIQAESFTHRFGGLSCSTLWFSDQSLLHIRCCGYCIHQSSEYRLF